MDMWDAFYGPNAGYAQELYERYLRDPDSVDEATRSFFDNAPASTATQAPHAPLAPSSNGRTPSAQAAVAVSERVSDVDFQKIVVAARLARSIREYGHLAAHINPIGPPGSGDPMLEPETHGVTEADLDALPGSIVFPDEGESAGTFGEAIRRLRSIYSGPVGYEFDHVNDFDERTWLHGQVEHAPRPALSEQDQRDLLRRLSQVEGFERYLHSTFPGQKRFSLEGNDMLVPMLDLVIDRSMEVGTAEILIGMAHRGRLNVLAHILGKPYRAILAQFQSAAAAVGTLGEAHEVTNTGWTGDVKYHLGARRALQENELHVEVTLADNPSHLELVDPVVEGFARAAQDGRDHPGPPGQDVDCSVPITLHGDAAFPAEGIVSETLNLSRLRGYTTGGTIRFIVNNQIGFTTSIEEGRSTLYASDLAKGFEIPIIHVNADVPEACLWVVELAHAYRERFAKDVLIDLVGYRRWGHNEGDEPSFTQPQMYAAITSHPTVRALYAQRLEAQGIISGEDAQRMLDEVRSELQRAREAAENGDTAATPVPPREQVALDEIETSVPADQLHALHDAHLDFPEDFQINSRLRRVLERRREALDKEKAIDWSLGESLALGSILADGTPIRLTGQDAQRGTFSQRHAALFDPETGKSFIPLQNIPQARASFAVYNSPLTESATLGFEYGYSVHAPDTLVLWEAQFGDFANVGQAILDQFITSAQAKWQQRPSLVLLLPHAYEGQGPEHSSARLERYLQLAAEDNIRIANCTTPAQYFHLLRLQAATLASDRRPLVLMTPKSLLRHPRATSGLRDLSEGKFHPILDDGTADPSTVRRIVFTSGKVAVDLRGTMEEQGIDDLALVRVELLYPFPAGEIKCVLEKYAKAKSVVWLQEEPRNMGAWSYVQPRLGALLPKRVELCYIGRPERAATAEGSTAAHAREQSRILSEALQGAPSGK